MSNLRISEIKFGMRLLHWMVVKILARKPTNSSRDDDNDLFFMWSLTHKTKNNWVRFIIDKMIHYRDNPKRLIFFSNDTTVEWY